MVCNNYEKHLRGNTYVEYADVRSAVSAYRGLHARWYGGKQLSMQFCQLISWKNAICGLQASKRCPKGRTCNFLHVFKNPIRLHDENRVSERQEDRTSSSRSWRWSESPERESLRRSKEDKKRKDRRNDEKESKDRDRRRHRHHTYRSRSHRYKD